ncbi:energy-coupling factor transporter transmembrane component T family protein [Subtercola boreus]|uniref:Cobalt ABC transporter permease n=1 Tax=Subtercola boreus TaxID=120213 RepID=A0A3E0W6Q5_9MICO|nr:energy-coupling factor transporter transmembrane component T [Subtercola boreus]RFA18152.1 cobalt ABC transporter permease [Subtercola boreus]RFA18534.1 cobalt ABC transporter permease [Subtercola boreus]RFA25062.1 cobalt ABC transporter permease [Subtercola boreus]
MLTLYRPGTGWLHRAPAGPKALALLVIVLAVSLMPSTWLAAAVGAGVAVACYLVPRIGLAELGRQIVAVRWIIVVTFGFQVIFLPLESATANTVRVVAAIVIAALLVLTTRVGDLLDAFELGLGGFRRFGLDPARVALVLAVAITTVPVLARIAVGVRESQRARGARAGIRSFVIPFLVVSLKHADDLGDALTARGVA